jgi:hypothetical protein
MKCLTLQRIASSLHRFIASSLHRFIASSLRRFIASSFHRFIASSLLLPSFGGGACALLVCRSGLQGLISIGHILTFWHL